MRHVHYDEVPAEPVEGAAGVTVRWLIGPKNDAPHFYMRRFEIAPGASTPHHAHPHEHEVYILEGEGVVFGDGGEQPFRPGNVVYMPGNEMHHFAAGRKPVAMLCLVPRTA